MKGWNASTDRGASPEVGGIRRRTLAKTAAWATPVFLTSVAAPASAASGPCVAGKASLQAGTNPVNLTFPASTVSAAITYAAFNSNGSPRSDSTPGDTGGVYTTTYAPSWNYLKLHLPERLRENQTLRMTLTFSRAVSGLSLRITDIDKSNDYWNDEVVVSPLGFTAVKAANVIGTGQTGDPFKSQVDGGISSALGNVTLTWAAPVTQVVIQFRAADEESDSGNGQWIGVGEIGFTC